MPARIFPESVRRMQASRSMRLKHELWHYSRGVGNHPRAGTIRERLAELEWLPAGERFPFGFRADETNYLLLDNHAGEDFLFMHREMIGHTNHALEMAGEPPISRWETIPTPGSTEFPVPPAWEYSDPRRSAAQNAGTTRFLERVKSDEYYESVMSVREAFFMSPDNLRRLSLGALGNLVEMTIHNMLHMRWAAEPRGYRPSLDVMNPTGGDPNWDELNYDYLGDTYSSHVNPHFWHLHGWVDTLADRWAEANGRSIEWEGTWLGGPDLTGDGHDHVEAAALASTNIGRMEALRKAASEEDIPFGPLELGMQETVVKAVDL